MKTIRNSDEIPLLYETVVQATLEVIGGIQSYGPFTFDVRPGYRGETVSVTYDQKKVLEFDRYGGQICIRYVRENDSHWVNELCGLAEAHAKLIPVE